MQDTHGVVSADLIGWSWSCSSSTCERVFISDIPWHTLDLLSSRFRQFYLPLWLFGPPTFLIIFLIMSTWSTNQARWRSSNPQWHIGPLQTSYSSLPSTSLRRLSRSRWSTSIGPEPAVIMFPCHYDYRLLVSNCDSMAIPLRSVTKDSRASFRSDTLISRS